MVDTLRTAEIGQNVFWVGDNEQNGWLHCNPYLLVDGDEAVLFDPGSVLDFEQVFENVTGIVPLDQIRYVVLHHQDPDFCVSVPLFEKKGAKFQIVTHWRTQSLVKYYGVKSEYYIVNEHDFVLKLKSGRKLKFIPTPYLHFPGAIATYDTQTKTLFSSDLFGAFSLRWELYAGDDYIEKMKTFHEHYMPSNEIMRPVMEVFLGMDIAKIAPQHGSIIAEDVKKYIRVLRDLECGTFLTPIKKSLAKSGGYAAVCSTVIKRYCSMFDREEVLQVIKELDIQLNIESLDITDYNYTGDKLWNLLFETIYIKKGLQWLTVVEPLTQKLSKEYDIALPDVFNSTLKKVEEETLLLSSENEKLKEINEYLKSSIVKTQDKLIKCPITGLYNETFFKNYFKTEISRLYEAGSGFNPVLMIISIDNIARMRFSYGEKEGNEVLKNFVYILNEIKEDTHILFKLEGENFAYYFPHSTMEAAVKTAEQYRNAIEMSAKFIEKLTVSIGLVSLDEIEGSEDYIQGPAETMMDVALMRVRIAKNMGANLVCWQSSIQRYQEEIGKVLIVDTDSVNVDVLKTFLENLYYNVIIASDGEEALKKAEKEAPNMIISEIMIPKIDGFLLREKLMRQSKTKNIPFVVVSHLKNEDSIERAISLNIVHYFKKPYMLSELLGVIKNRIKGDINQ